MLYLLGIGDVLKKRITLVATSILLIAFLLVPTACVPKKTDATNPTATEQLQSRIVSLETKVAQQASIITTLQSQGSQNLQPAIAQLQADLATTNAKIAELQTKITELEVVKEEEEEEETKDVDPEDAVEVDVRYPSVITVNSMASDTTAIVTAPVRLKLENALNVDIEDIELSARTTLRADSGLDITDIELTGDLEWYPYGFDNFESWDDIELGAKERESYQLLLSITVKALTDIDVTKNIRLTFRVYCEDYEVVE